ncbi:winged helix-turn-helix transcriptional regulator [Lacisediminimonas profundi]|uniref:winged helix-turn-helix transcriptional regulator n=1 Tax=Lacisediminimonas profundi TaxID=2603856 RepID=UPI00124AE6C1|nr:helix-turn-helix domain-containing protein [Lacisediminimonas profundi]
MPEAPAIAESQHPVKSFPSISRFCSVARTLEILQDAWSFLVLRESFFGARRYEQFQASLGLPRTTLAKRLNHLTELGLLVRESVSAGSLRSAYRMSDAGLDLFQTMMVLLAFGDKWLRGEQRPPLQLVHRSCGKACSPLVVCSACKGEIDPHDVTYRNGPGAGSHTHMAERKRSRRASDPMVLERGRPCSVARTLQIIGDRWSFLVIREMFFGVRRFDEFQANLGIASNILTDRLQRLTEAGVVDRRAYRVRPERFEYRFTPKGRDLYASMIVMMHWGDKWVSGGKPPLILRHRVCQNDFHAEVVCSECREPLEAHNVNYFTRYTLEGVVAVHALPRPASDLANGDAGA